MAKNHLKIVTFFIILLSFIFSGCIGSTSQQSVYYIFNSSQEISTSPSPLKDLGLGVGPVKLPGFLKRPQIVTRQEQNLLGINEFHRWGDSLEEQTTITMVENLSKMLNTPNVSAYPWERPFSPAYQVVIEFRRFDGEINDSVKLEAIWWIIETKENKQISTKRSSFEQPTNGNGYKAYVIAQNLVLENLCREIADSIKALP